MRLMLDTNAYSALMKGQPEVAERVRRAEQILISSIVAGELLFGFRNGSRMNENMERFDAFLANSFVSWVPVTLVTADRFSRIAAALRKGLGHRLGQDEAECNSAIPGTPSCTRPPWAEDGKQLAGTMTKADREYR
jgi:tRNA(fMet)-specific endonuclease VapC